MPILSGGGAPAAPQQSTADAVQQSVSTGTGGGALGVLAGNAFGPSKDLDPKSSACTPSPHTITCLSSSLFLLFKTCGTFSMPLSSAGGCGTPLGMKAIFGERVLQAERTVLS